MPIFLGNKQIDLASLGSLPVSNIQQNVLDLDTVAFAAATGITGSAVIAVNNLVVSLKNENIWNNLYAIYPMVGGNATAHKYNLKNPQDTNGAYRLNFQGGWTHNSDGAKPDGIAGTYADTFAVPSTLFIASNASGIPSSGSLSYFSFTNSTAAGTPFEIGATGAARSGECSIIMRDAGGNQFHVFAGTDTGIGAASSDGFSVYSIGQLGDNTKVDFKNGVQIQSGNVGGTTLTNRTLFLGACNDGTTSLGNSDRGCSFATIGLFISNMTTFSTIVNNFQIALGRYSY
jgi:hypothetical protein